MPVKFEWCAVPLAEARRGDATLALLAAPEKDVVQLLAGVEAKAKLFNEVSVSYRVHGVERRSERTARLLAQIRSTERSCRFAPIISDIDFHLRDMVPTDEENGRAAFQ